jgi:diadenosine tetraphosphate (Ap4A) HIT family hydrolase
MGKNRGKFKSQIFWEGDQDLSHWYSYANRSPQLWGHIILANDQKNTNIKKAPQGFETALNINIELLLKWAQKYKADGCLPVFFRMNIAKEQFRVHILPVSHQEIEEASASLVARIPRLAGRKGGFLFYLGNREHIADQLDAEFRERAENEDAVEKLMKDGGIPVIVAQLRKIAKTIKPAGKLD